MPDTKAISPDVRAAAERLARANLEAEPNIQEVYWFPAEAEVRLIELDPTAFASDEISPFYFGPDPAGGIPFPMGIATIRPSEKGRLQPPAHWGRWEDAERIWPST